MENNTGTFSKWGLKILVASLPAVVSGIFSYFSARSDTEISYKTLVRSVKELQEEVKTQNQLVYATRGELEILRQVILLPKKDPSGALGGSSGALPRMDAAIVSKSERLFEPKALPDTFSDIRRSDKTKLQAFYPQKGIPAETILSP